MFETPTIIALQIDRSLGNRGCIAHNFFVIFIKPQQKKLGEYATPNEDYIRAPITQPAVEA
jgi:hypothetical protein